MNYSDFYSQDCFDHAIKTNQLDPNKTYMYMGSNWDNDLNLYHHFKDKITREYTYVSDSWENWNRTYNDRESFNQSILRHTDGKDSDELAMSRIESRIY